MYFTLRVVRLMQNVQERGGGGSGGGALLDLGTPGNEVTFH